jgi:hypothetical protein
MASLAACGSSSDDGGAGSGGSAGSPGANVEALAQTACAQEGAAEFCSPFSDCVEDWVDEHRVAAVKGCSAEYITYLECAGTGTWVCEQKGGGTYTNEPEECSTLRSDAVFCGPNSMYSRSGGTCEMDFDDEGAEFGGSCTDDGASCSCTKGTKIGATFTIEDCEAGSIAEGVFANCK